MTPMIDERALDDEVEIALGHLKGRVSDDELEQMKLVLRLTLQHHPELAALTNAVLPHKAVESSSEVGKDGETPEKPAQGHASGDKE